MGALGEVSPQPAPTACRVGAPIAWPTLRAIASMRRTACGVDRFSTTSASPATWNRTDTSAMAPTPVPSPTCDHNGSPTGGPDVTGLRMLGAKRTDYHQLWS